MFWKKNKTENTDKANKKNCEENEIYYKCPFKCGDTITVDTANLVDYPIGVVSDRTYFKDSFFYVSWQRNLETPSKYWLSVEIPKVSTNKNQWEHFVLLSDFLKKKKSEEKYLIAKVSPVNSVVTDGEADIYYAALFDFRINKWNTPYVLVKNRRDNGFHKVPNLEICKIEEIVSREEYPHKVQAEIICAVNVEDYLHRESVRKENSKLYTTLIREYNIEPKQLKALELEEISNPLLKKFKKNLKYTF